MKDVKHTTRQTEYYRRKERRGYVMMRVVKDLAMSTIILLMAFLMLLGDKFALTAKVVYGIDPLMKYLFGGLCLMYGSFRLYRAIKHDY